jgi:hypothetical protein
VRATLGVAPGWAVVGDADYHRDPITGHGMTDAFRDAELLAVAIGSALRSPRDESAALAGYARARNAAVRETFELTRDQPFPPLPRLIELQIQGDIDLRGILGLDPGVRNGFQGVRVTFHVQGRSRRRETRRAGSPVAEPVRGLRHPHQRRPGHHRRSVPLIMTNELADTVREASSVRSGRSTDDPTIGRCAGLGGAGWCSPPASLVVVRCSGTQMRRLRST